MGTQPRKPREVGRDSSPGLACARGAVGVVSAPPKRQGPAARAGVAQWQSTCFVNRWLGVQVPSSARCLFMLKPNQSGGLPEWPKGADCKSAGYAFDGSNPSPSTAPSFSLKNRRELGTNTR